MYLFTPHNSTSTGYGLMEKGLLYGFEQAGQALTPCSADNPPQGSVTLVPAFPDWGAHPALAHTRRWVFTMSESNLVSPAWVKYINTYFERCLVPCPPLVDIYKNSGVTIPVDFIPLGVDYNPPPFVDRNPNPEQFIWLGYSLGDSRKGADLTLFAFDRVCGHDPRFKLWIKCRDNPRWLGYINDDRVTLITGETSHQEWLNLLSQVNGFVFPSRGEGWGMPPREAVLSGLPTIATQWLGMWDADQWAFPVGVDKYIPAQFDYVEANAEGSYWVEPKSSDIDQHMRWIIEHYEAALIYARLKREILLNCYSWKQTVDRILGL